jgi:hypothetical protein
MEIPGNYNNINGFDDFGSTLREQKRAALLNCVPVFVDNLQTAGFNLAEFFNAMSTYCDRIGYSQSVVKSLEDLAQDFEKVK